MGHGQQADHNDHHYHLGVPGAVGHALSAQPNRPVRGGAVSSSKSVPNPQHRSSGACLDVLRRASNETELQR